MDDAENQSSVRERQRCTGLVKTPLSRGAEKS